MPRKNELSDDIRLKVLEFRALGKSYREIAKDLNISPKGARKVCLKRQETGSIKNRPRTGRKRCTSRREDSRLQNMAKKSPKSSAKEIKMATEVDCSLATVRRRINEAGLNGRVVRKVPLLSEKNRLKRLKFAREHLKKPLDFWKKTILSDESKFCVRGSNRKQYCWRRKNDEFNPKNTTGTVKHDKYVMLWGCFSYNGIGNSVEISGKMDRYMYRDILKNNLNESAARMGLGSDFIFQQDNDPKHASKVLT